MARRPRRKRSGGDQANPYEYAERTPEWVAEPMRMQPPSCAHSQRSHIPNVVTQTWLGGGKFMYAKLLSVLSVSLLVRPERHVLLYDTDAARHGEEWGCACKLASCEQTHLRRRVYGRELVSGDDPTDRYASDRLGRCANSQLDVLRLDALLQWGGALLDLDVFALRSLDSWRRCAPAPTVIGARRRASGGAELGAGVVLAGVDASFVRRWRESYRGHTPSRDFGTCNRTDELAAAAPPGEVHAAAELGPLPRYKTRAAYEQHIATATLVHMSGFRHPWRLHDVMVHRLLERVWEAIQSALNQSGAALRSDPQLRACLNKLAGACWAKRGGRCGIYGA